jgi:hypothetical protein
MTSWWVCASRRSFIFLSPGCFTITELISVEELAKVRLGLPRWPAAGSFTSLAALQPWHILVRIAHGNLPSAN